MSFCDIRHILFPVFLRIWFAYFEMYLSIFIFYGPWILSAYRRPSSTPSSWKNLFTTVTVSTLLWVPVISLVLWMRILKSKSGPPVLLIFLKTLFKDWKKKKKKDSSSLCHFESFLLGDLWRLFFVLSSESLILMLTHLWPLHSNFCKMLSRLLKKMVLSFLRL